MTTEEVVKSLLEQCEALKRKHEGSFKLNGVSFTRANLETLIVWLEEGCTFNLGQEEKWLLAALMG